MNKYCIFALAFIYLEIFSRQTTGLNYIQYLCAYSYHKCLNISDVKVNWEAANSICTEQGGGLFDPIWELLGYNGIPLNAGEYYWTEIHRVRNTKYFQTADGYNISDYYNPHWKTDHPKDSIDCVGFDGESNELLSLECNATNLGACRIDFATCDALVEEYKDFCPSLAIRPENLTEDILRNLSNNFNITTGDHIQLYNYTNALVVTQVSANTTTEIIHYGDIIQISEDQYEARKTIVWSILAVYTNSTFIVGDHIFTVYTSSIGSVANLTIVFRGYYITEEYVCVHLTSEGHWSTEGVDTEFISSQTVHCTTKIQNIRTIAVGRFIIHKGLIILTVIISLLSFLLLLSSLVTFIASGKKFFSHDINILHFNNTLSLFLALLSIFFIPLPIYYNQVFQPICKPVKFFLHFLWTNVFLSSLSIAIVVFYTIWIVSINHTARKLSIVLIPIGWGVSLIWAVIWTTHRFLNGDSSIVACFFSSNAKFEIPWSTLAPMIVILLLNTALLIASLFKVWLVHRKQSSQQGELKRRRKVVISGILLVPALGLPFITLIAIQLYKATEGINMYEQNILAFVTIMLINSPIGIIHFILITCQIRETIIRKYCCCCCCRRITPAQIAHSLHLNILRPRPKQKNHQTLIEESTIQQTPEDNIPDSVPSLDSAVCSNDSPQAVI